MDGLFLTEKQMTILDLVQKGAPDGDFVDMDQLYEALPYKCSKQALQCSIRFLEKRGYLERKEPELRRGRKRRIISLTPDAIESRDPDTGHFDIVVEK